jgi:transcriptional regulator with XRE-family HTH domain
MKTLPNIILKVALMKKGLTQRDLAFGCRIDESRISRIIKGYEKPTPEIERAIADRLGMGTEELFAN